MDDGFKREMKGGCRKEILNGIEDAKKGELSPHWQEYLRRDAQAAREGGYYPEDADILLAELDAVLVAVPQVSDTELNRRQLAACDVELLYDYPSDDYDTLVQLSYAPDKQVYTAAVFLDSGASAPNPEAYVEKIRQAVLQWVHSQKITFDEAEIPDEVPANQTEHFDSLKGALQYVFSALRHPETLL